LILVVSGSRLISSYQKDTISGEVGIGFSLFVVVIASLNLVMDFDFIESDVEHEALKGNVCSESRHLFIH